MRLTKKLFFATFLAAGAFCIGAQDSPAVDAQESAMDKLDGQIFYLENYLNQGPPNFKSEKEEAGVREKLASAIAMAEKMGEQNPNSAPIKNQIGKLYQMAHNIDVDSSWEKAEKNLKEAMRLDSNFVDPYVSLGFLYVGADMGFVKDAEKLFLKAQSLNGKKPLLQAHRGLVYVYDYLGEPKKAIQEADLVLKLSPQDDEIRNRRATIKSK